MIICFICLPVHCSLIKPTDNPHIDWHLVCSFQDVFRRLNGCNRLIRSVLINLTRLLLVSKLGESMFSSSAYIVLQNRRISQSETSTISICEVVNIIELQHVRVSGDRNVTLSVF